MTGIAVNATVAGLERFKDQAGFITQKGKRKKYEPIILGVKKSTLDQTVARMSLSLTIEEAFRNLVKSFQLLKCWSGKKINQLRRVRISHIFTAMGLPGTFGWGILSLYSLVEDAAAMKNALKQKDYERIKDRSLALTANATNLSASGVGAAASIDYLKGHAGKVKVLSHVASCLGTVVYGLLLVIETLGFFRIRRESRRMNKIFAHSLDVHTTEGKIALYAKGLERLYARISVSKSEEKMILEKVGGDKSHPRYRKLLTFVMERKERKFQRRVGSELTLLIRNKALGVLENLNSKDVAVRDKAMMDAEYILRKYKCTLYKRMHVKILKVVGAALGLVAAALSLTTPLGLAIISAGLVFISSAYFLRAWYGENYWTERYYEKGFFILNRQVDNYVIPSAIEVIENKQKEKLKKMASKTKGEKSLYALYLEHHEKRLKNQQELSRLNDFKKHAISTFLGIPKKVSKVFKKINKGIQSAFHSA